MKTSQRIAIVGMGGVFPGASNLVEFWDNIQAARDCAQEVPDDRWLLDKKDVYAREVSPDKVNSIRGCFVDSFTLDPEGLDIDKAILARLDPMFHLLLHAGRQAWEDTVTEKLERKRVGVIIGNIVLPTDTASAIADEILGPVFESQILGKPIEEQSKTDRLNRYVAGLPAGVLAKALGLGGGSYTLDAACASSLYALKYAAEELQAGRADAMLTGGLSRPDCLYTQMGFSQLQAISGSGRCSPFDGKADGLVVGEGAGIVVLKRLDDALRDCDHIYATIAGIGLSNDIGANLMSPDSEGQLRAMHAAYQQAGWTPQDIDLIECHGTGTPVGDAVEYNSLISLWHDDADIKQDCIIGSVKSNIGHLLTAAGSAGLIKILLAIKNQQLPPTANFEHAAENINLENSPFTVLQQARNWQARSGQRPRKAAVSAFGFGGINAHVLLEEWQVSSELSKPIRNRPQATMAPAVAIVGMEAQFGPWKSLASFQQRVLGGDEKVDPAAPNHWWGVENKRQLKGYFIDEVSVPLGRFRIPPSELREMLPQQLLMLQVAANAIEDAGLGELTGAEKLSTGVFIGIGLDLNTTNFHFRWSMLDRAKAWANELGLALSEEELQQWACDLRDAAGPPLTANRTMGALGGIVASRVARALRIGGPSFTLSSEESSGLRALEAGVRALQRGELNTAIVGAVDLAGDVRAVLSQDDYRAFSSQGVTRPFDEKTEGAVIGEGATALILKRYDEAVRDGNSVYAVIRGIGAASGGGVDQIIPAEEAYKLGMQRACQDAGITLQGIGLVETHGSGHAGEDAMEASTLAELFKDENRELPCVIGSVKADIGHTGAAAGLASVVRASLCLQQHILPSLRNQKTLISSLANQDNLFPPAEPQFWLRNRGEGPRRAAVNTFSVDGVCLHAILEEVPQDTNKVSSLLGQPMGIPRDELFAIFGEKKSDIILGIDQLQSLAAETDGKGINQLACAWWKSNNSDQNKQSICLVIRDINQLSGLLVKARQVVEQNNFMAGDGIFYNPDPLGRKGKLAFVYPGSGNHFHGMGRDLGCWWPDVLNRLDQENEFLASQFADGQFWRHKPNHDLSHEDVIFGQVWLGTLVSDVVCLFGIRPEAIIGYSLGETAGLFATRTWTERDEMLQRMQETDLFTRQLAGPCESVRKAWYLSRSQSVDWLVGVIDRPAAEIKEAVADRPHVYLLIINTPNECVIGGDRDAVLSLVKTLNCQFHPVPFVTTVHCEVARPVQGPYRDLHLFNTAPPEGVTFYSGVLGRAYVVNRDSAADSIVGQALQCFDYTQVINSAYEDGVRLFIEMGPGASCTRMIDQILADRPHLAQAICIKGQDCVASVLHTIARLIAEQVPIDLGVLYNKGQDEERETNQSSLINVAIGGQPFVVPPPPSTRSIPDKDDTVLPFHSQVGVNEEGSINSLPVASGSTNIVDPVIAQMQATESARAETQEVFLRVANGLTETLGQALSLQMTLLQSIPDHKKYVDMATPFHSTDDSLNVGNEMEREVAFDREQCLEFAIGAISKVLGASFADIDQHPTRVRLPDEPLMLVDRIIEVEGEPDSMQSGRVATEHDVLAGAWYLDGGRIPVCIAVEAGQADLFLSGYLGIDHITRGLAVYRLLDAQITFHGSLPRPGETIHYDIHIDHFFRNGDTWLFRFNFEGTVNGKPLLTMTNGCAGFFTQEELDAGQGIVLTELEQRHVQGKQPDDWIELIPMQVESYNDEKLTALREGRLVDCFGEGFEHLDLTDPIGLPGGQMTLVHRVLMLDPRGGRFGLGQITGEADIHPDDWFLTCHFVDDRVMPGTLMYECCLHTLRIYLLRMGWVANTNEVVYEPIPEVISQLKCRGQVIEKTHRVQYEITLKEIGYQNKTGTPYVLADALMYADGKAIVQMNNMSVQLTGLDRERVEALWQNQLAKQSLPTVRKKDAIFDADSILAFAVGKPSEAFGERYCIFDEQRVIARLPGPPYQFLDRITAIENCEQWQLKAGGTIRAEYDVPEDAWYFNSDRQPCMPFAVLLEVALQPCGWLAAYLGSALNSDTDLSFRNLGGKATQFLGVTPTTGTLVIKVKITNVSISGGMIIQNFDFEVACDVGIVYSGDTYFGFFSKEALADQVGIRDVIPYQPDKSEITHCRSYPYPVNAPYPDAMMRMVDQIDVFIPAGGPHGLGFIRGTTRVDPEAWFFKAHFYQDPVWPGSLGLESFMQLLKVVAMVRWQNGSNGEDCRFESMAVGTEHSWVYRGQIIPSDSKVVVQAVINEVDDVKKQLRAEGFLTVDDRIIYQMSDFTLRMRG
jgi:acyl transferase domain-containing protein/3-hydroxymyristoyl/3-hydroxydecanoyl-(acyl carrier protein) dehydratase